jgi:hypothetical protein
MSDQFSALGFQWVPDREFLVPTLDEVESALKLTNVERLKFMDAINDCDDFALQLHAAVNLLRAEQARNMEIPSDEHIPWAFGEAFGIQFQGEQYQHSCCIALTQKGIYLIEPQTDEMWVAGGGDVVLCVKF